MKTLYPVSPLVVTGGSFRQLAVPLTTYLRLPQYRQTGLWAGAGTVQLGQVLFQDLHQGYVGQASQVNGEVRGNSFVGCQLALAFFSNAPGGNAGRVHVGCNTFIRPAGTSGNSIAILRSACGFVGGACNQVDISTTPGGQGNPNGIPRLQTNKFLNNVTQANSGNFLHLVNEGPGQITYQRYSASPNGSVVIANDATEINDPIKVNLPMPQGALPANICINQGFPPDRGLNRTVNTPLPGGDVSDQPYYLAQNVPNPCSATTSVSYRVPPQAQGTRLVVRGYLSGRVLLEQALAPGEHTVDINVAKLPAGVYHYALEADGRPLAHHKLLIQ